jgi:DNA-binding response OmpR family regulator
VPVIVITADDEPGTAEQVRALGASAYLKKPVDRDALLSAIAAATFPDKNRGRGGCTPDLTAPGFGAVPAPGKPGTVWQ